MFRTLGVVIGGMFVGAVAMEIIRKKYPESLDQLYAKASELGANIKEGFKEGFCGAAKPRAGAGA
ncbi:MAG TPA: hypothetical protein HPP77_09300 [Candidatus Hydrogenedentes bacterium]|nr:hypothetical protein [Candidatus Hydrogenedentota bacterium]